MEYSESFATKYLQRLFIMFLYQDAICYQFAFRSWFSNVYHIGLRPFHQLHPAPPASVMTHFSSKAKVQKLLSPRRASATFPEPRSTA